ncbi:SPOSA6832_03457, partial [Sporobolomyces salmonicolor]
MQGFNKYYPPDYEPGHGSLNKYHGKHALGDRARKIDQGILVVRFELPFNIWWCAFLSCFCSSPRRRFKLTPLANSGHCNNHIGQGVRYNAEKKKVGNYHSSPIWSFRCKCHLCQHWFEIRTDPQNTRYVVHEGARQKNEEGDAEENGQIVIGSSLSCLRFNLPLTSHPGFLLRCLFTRKDTSASTSTAPPDPFASLEKSVTQKTRALSESARLSSLYEQSAAQWSDPYAASSALRASFRKKKKHILESEGRAEGVRDKFGLGERVRVEDLRTPARKEDAEEERRQWEEAKKKRVGIDEEREGKRKRQEEQVGWASTTARPRTRDRFAPSMSSSRAIKPLPSRSSSSTLNHSSKPSPSLRALHDKLSLASALKNDPFASSSSSSTPKSTSPGLGGAVRVVKKAPTAQSGL